MKKILIIASLLIVGNTVGFAQSVRIIKPGSTTYCTTGASGVITAVAQTTPSFTVLRWEEGTYSGGQFNAQQITYTSSTTYSFNLTAIGSRSFRAFVEIANGSVGYTNVLTITVASPATGGTLSGPSTTSYLGSATGTLTLSGYISQVNKWIANGATINSTSNTHTFSNLTQTTEFYAYVTNGICAAPSNRITIYVYKPGTLTGPSTVADGDKANLTLTNYYGTIVRWEYSRDDGVTWSPLAITSHFFSPTVQGPSKYRVLVDLASFGQQYSTIFDINPVPYTQVHSANVAGQNYVTAQKVTVAGTTIPALVDGLASDKKRESVTYTDGLGRPVQQINRKATPLGEDILSFTSYDQLGRITTQYLPYVPSSTAGTYRTQFLSEQLSYYANGAADKVADSSYPFAKTIYENSPLARVIEQGTVGQDWQPGGHTQLISYQVNDANEVRLFQPDGSSAAFYAQNELSKVEWTDPDGKKIQSFTDKRGLTILIKTQLDETIAGVNVPWLETYTVYDLQGKIRYIISPKGVALLKSNSWQLTTSIKDQFVTELVYDNLGRLVEKKVPGQSTIYFCYDHLDRIVLVQDGNLRPDNKWFYIKYDRQGRPVMQGLYTDVTNPTRIGVQENVIDPLYESPTQKYYEERGTALHGYSNQTFPTTNAEVLFVNYYDTYDFDYNGTDDYTFTPQNIGEGMLGSSRGLVTGSKRLIIGTGTWLYTYLYYTPEGHLLQVRSNNHLSAGVDNLTTNVYDFEGKLTRSKLYHNAGLFRNKTVNTFYQYDNQGRILKILQALDGGSAQQCLVQYEYNELGQLVDKKLHNTSGTNYLQSIDYRYNIQGWLQSINNSQLNVNSNNDDSNDYFGMEFLYQAVETGLNNGTYYNGSVSAVKWKGPSTAAGANDQSSYKFTYDKGGQLKSAAFQRYSGSSWSKEANAFNESVSYDHNGNILSLQRNQRKHQLSGNVPSYISETIDNLIYTYASGGGNRLTRVEDATGNPLGFKNGSGSSTEYAYDTQGNVTADLNKGISGIVYNFLGKPSQVNFTDGRKIEYLYDAAGNKLSMKNYLGANLISTTDYVNGFVYDNGVFDFMAVPEGRLANAESGQNLIANAACGSTAGFTPNQNVSLSAVVIGSQNYVKAVCNQSTSTPGIYPIGGIFSVTPGETYVFRVRGYATGDHCFLFVNTNLGNLVWPGSPLPVGATNEKTVNVKFIAPPGATHVRIGVLWRFPVVGQEMYLNHVELVKLNLEYQYAIADHQGNTRVVFSSDNKSETKIATFESNSGDNSGEFQNVISGNVVTSVAANHTVSGSQVVKMNQSYKIGPSKSLKVYPGDKVDLEVWEYHEGSSGFGTNSTPLTTLISLVAGVFGGTSGGVGESAVIYNGVETAINEFLPPGNQGSSRPAAYLNYILFDKDFKVLDMGWQLAPGTTFTKQKLSFNTINIEEPGYMFVYLSYDNSSDNWVYFDDLKITHTKTNVVQYNEYYPFGLPTNKGWTRENNSNNYLYNSGSELNQVSNWYETMFRGYDPALGRFMQVDPLAVTQSNFSPYHYASNNPVMFNDPLGLQSNKPRLMENDEINGSPAGGGGWSGSFVGAEGDAGVFFILAGKEIGNVLTFTEIAGGGAADAGLGIELGRIDYTGSPSKFGSEYLYGIRDKVWLSVSPFGEFISVGGAFSWSSADGTNKVYATSIQLGFGVSPFPFLSGGCNHGKISK